MLFLLSPPPPTNRMSGALLTRLPVEHPHLRRIISWYDWLVCRGADFQAQSQAFMNLARTRNIQLCLSNIVIPL
jgi:hypothetical protein